MIVRGPRKERDFTILSNALLRDQRISFRARGILACLLSYPPGHRFTADDLHEGSPEGRDACRAAFRELRAVGYAELREGRDAAGRITKEWIIHEETVAENPQPSTCGIPASGLTSTDTPKPQVAPHAEKPQVVSMSLEGLKDSPGPAPGNPPAGTCERCGRGEIPKHFRTCLACRDLPAKTARAAPEPERPVLYADRTDLCPICHGALNEHHEAHEGPTLSPEDAKQRLRALRRPA